MPSAINRQEDHHGVEFMQTDLFDDI